MKNNNLDYLLENRYSCRSYLSEEVRDDDIRKILYSATLSPSTNNRQPWSFVVVKNKDIKNEIAQLLEEKGKENNNQAFIMTSKAIYEAPILLCVFNKVVDDESISIIQSIGACIENMLLKAEDLGLSSLWIRATSCIEKEIAEKLNKEKEHLMACITLGYSDKERSAKNRKNIDEITNWL